jgi:death-on-curing protein
VTIEWIELPTVLAIHADQIAENGGSPGVRDESLLRSALARPQNLAAYDPGAGLHRLAASYAFGLVRDHGFVDGNKRVALATAGVVLMINGQRLDATEREVERMTFGLAAGDIGQADYAAWIERNMVPLER